MYQKNHQMLFHFKYKWADIKRASGEYEKSVSDNETCNRRAYL